MPTSEYKNAIGYARVSTADQADSGASIAAQRAKIEAYATLNDMELVEIIAGTSASSALDVLLLSRPDELAISVVRDSAWVALRHPAVPSFRFGLVLSIPGGF